jgi:murein DD-endopeptidase MepM/ murein hydrolase activator NlpD
LAPATASTPTATARSPWRAPVAGALLCAVCSLVVPAAADDSVRDARRSRDEARSAQARAAAQIDVLHAQDGELARGLRSIEQAVAAQRAVVDDATRAVAAAEEAAQQRRTALDETDAQLAAARSWVADLAVAGYIGRTFDDSVSVVLESSDAADAVRRAALLELLHGSERDAIDRLRELEARRAGELELAAEAAAAADASRESVAAALAELETQLDTQSRLRAEHHQRIAAWEREQDELAAQEAALTELLARRRSAALGSAKLSSEALEGFVMPTAGSIGSRFGPRLHPIYRISRQHAGVDMSGRTGDPVNAAKAGSVLFAGTRGGYGNVVILEHVGGVTTVYAHLSTIEAKPGARVATGQRIGRIGSTGLSTGPHLHFEVRVDGVAKDPELFLP